MEIKYIIGYLIAWCCGYFAGKLINKNLTITHRFDHPLYFKLEPDVNINKEKINV